MLLMLTLVQTWHFVLFPCCRGVSTCPRSECMHWEEEVKAMKATGLQHCVCTPRKSGPSLHSNLSIQLIAILYAGGQKRRKVAWIHILSPSSLCPRLLLNSVWLASRTTTFKAANRKPAVLSDGDMERKG